MKLHFGMAQWHHPAWIGWLYSANIPANRRLAEYAKVFDSVEVGSSFYADLTEQQLSSWYNQVPNHFRFCFKIPQTITHQLVFQNPALACNALEEFCQLLSPYSEKLGPIMMQFPANLGADAMPVIEALCQSWTLPSPLSIEVRNLSFFDKGEVEANLLRLLTDKQVNRVVMDSRPVFATDAYCESLIDAQRKKPRVPCHPTNTSLNPVVRFIGHPDLVINELYLDQWTKKLAQWLELGLEPYIFVHSSDNVSAPLLAQLLENKIAQTVSSYQSQIKIPEPQIQESLL